LARKRSDSSLFRHDRSSGPAAGQRDKALTSLATVILDLVTGEVDHSPARDGEELVAVCVTLAGEPSAMPPPRIGLDDEPQLGPHEVGDEVALRRDVKPLVAERRRDAVLPADRENAPLVDRTQLDRIIGNERENVVNPRAPTPLICELLESHSVQDPFRVRGHDQLLRALESGAVAEIDDGPRCRGGRDPLLSPDVLLIERATVDGDPRDSSPGPGGTDHLCNEGTMLRHAEVR